MVTKLLDMKRFPVCVGIIGSRSFKDDPKGDMKLYEEVRRFVYKLPKDVEIVSGGARGIDSYAEDAAYVRGVRTRIFLPDEKVPSPARFHKRNTELVQYLYKQEGVLVAFMDEDSHRGTASTIQKAKKLGIPVFELLYTQSGKFVLMLAPTEYLLDKPTEVV